MCSRESLNKFDSFKKVNNEKVKHFEDAIEGALKKTKSAHKEIIENWTRTNRDAIAISRTFFNFTEVQSILGRAKSAIDRTIVAIEKAKDMGLLDIDAPFVEYDYQKYMPKQTLSTNS